MTELTQIAGSYKGPLGQLDALLRIAVALERIASMLEVEDKPRADRAKAWRDAYDASRRA